MSLPCSPPSSIRSLFLCPLSVYLHTTAAANHQPNLLSVHNSCSPVSLFAADLVILNFYYRTFHLFCKYLYVWLTKGLTTHSPQYQLLYILLMFPLHTICSTCSFMSVVRTKCFCGYIFVLHCFVLNFVWSYLFSCFPVFSRPY
jgi:hypothetical protein